VVVKGSRVVGLEWLAEALRRGVDAASEPGLAS
jgi:hypothetical protein